MKLCYLDDTAYQVQNKCRLLAVNAGCDDDHAVSSYILCRKTAPVLYLGCSVIQVTKLHRDACDNGSAVTSCRVWRSHCWQHRLVGRWHKVECYDKCWSQWQVMVTVITEMLIVAFSHCMLVHCQHDLYKTSCFPNCSSIFTVQRTCIARTMPWQDVCLSVRLSHRYWV